MRRWLAILFVLALMGSAAAAPAADKDKDKQKSKPAAQQQEQQEKKDQKDQKDDKEAPKGSWYDSDEVKGSIFNGVQKRSGGHYAYTYYEYLPAKNSATIH